MLIYENKKKQRKTKQTKIKITEQKTGRKQVIGLRDNVPAKCSTPRRICLICKINVIHKNDLNYETKVCKQCTPIEVGSATPKKDQASLSISASPGPAQAKPEQEWVQEKKNLNKTSLLPLKVRLKLAKSEFSKQRYETKQVYFLNYFKCPKCFVGLIKVTAALLEAHLRHCDVALTPEFEKKLEYRLLYEKKRQGT